MVLPSVLSSSNATPVEVGGNVSSLDLLAVHCTSLIATVASSCLCFISEFHFTTLVLVGYEYLQGDLSVPTMYQSARNIVAAFAILLAIRDNDLCATASLEGTPRNDWVAQHIWQANDLVMQHLHLVDCSSCIVHGT